MGDRSRKKHQDVNTKVDIEEEPTDESEVKEPTEEALPYKCFSLRLIVWFGVALALVLVVVYFLSQDKHKQTYQAKI